MTSHITVRDTGPVEGARGLRSVYVCAGPAGPEHRLVGALVMTPEDGAELAARVAAGELSEESITWEVAAQVLQFYGHPGMRPGRFVTSLIRLLDAADPLNAYRLNLVYPGYVQAVRLARYAADGIARLQVIASRAEEGVATSDH